MGGKSGFASSPLPISNGVLSISMILSGERLGKPLHPLNTGGFVGADHRECPYFLRKRLYSFSFLMSSDRLLIG